MINVEGLKVLIALAAIMSAMAIAACGSSSKPSSPSKSASNLEAAGISFADCMRSHGVPNFPDPSSAGGGVQFSGYGINSQSPAFRSAQSACQKLMPGGIGAPVGVSATRIGQGLKIAACMRAHGLRTFPDPATSPPSTPPAGKAMILGGPDGVFSLSASMVQSPAFKQAAATCGFPSFGHGFKTPVAAPSG
ncbi:MAG: hypothetical protein ACLP0J_09650 [Solirubrobacteraceae bacterium]